MNIFEIYVTIMAVAGWITAIVIYREHRHARDEAMRPLGRDKIETCPRCNQMVFVSYFLYKTHLETADLCHNARRHVCAKCNQPECDLTGWEKLTQEEIEAAERARTYPDESNEDET